MKAHHCKVFPAPDRGGETLLNQFFADHPYIEVVSFKVYSMPGSDETHSVLIWGDGGQS